VVEGVAVDPGPLTGISEYHSARQLTITKKKVEDRGLNVADLEGTLTNYRMTQDKQLETLTVQLTNVEPSPSSFNATTVESEIRTLGGGLWLVTEGTLCRTYLISCICKGTSDYSAQSFAALLVTTEEEFTEAGIAGFHSYYW
jgi:hypothetical protein